MKLTTYVWRYSHLTLAISSSIFILIAAVTGIILSFEPISNQLKPYAITTDNLSLSQTISSLKKEYKEVITIDVNEHNFVTAAVITKNGKNETFYINPITGKKISSIVSKSSIFKWTTNLHRSLFLKSTGRFLVGFFSFLLLLITITGSILIIKRQGGIIRFFTKVVKEGFNQYYHVIIGRFTLIPIVIITVTAVYLSLEKFSLLPENNINHTFDFSEISLDKKISAEEFSIFKDIQLNEVKSIEFPFSDDAEDFFFLKLKTKELIVHQYSGEIISDKNLSWVYILSDWSLFLHTGRGTIIWAIMLLLSCLAILFFIYSGFAMTLERKRKNSLPKNKFKKENSEIIILVGSETGSTFSIASSLYDALITDKKTVYIDHLNNYTSYNKATQLIVLTATYGEGQPPSNASNFLTLAEKIKQKNPINYAVVGFGSLAYPEYCKFAFDIDNVFKKKKHFSPTLPLYKINNQNFNDFKTWGTQWSQKTNIDLQLKQKLAKPKKQQAFSVINTTELNTDASFLIRLRPLKKMRFSSGDLLAITPKKDNITRLYSVGKIDNDILLSIKKHELGVCSNLLFNLKSANTLLARIEKNKGFHFSKKSKSTILIANGTGIAPFLGMLNSPSTTHLFWGGRTKESLKMYNPFLKNVPNSHIYIAYSQEQKRQYVQDLILKEQALIASTLKNNGTIMICGSISMMNGVIKVLERISLHQLNTPLSTFQKANQIKTDCY
ncbi:PepSY domain-containing protein [Tenacibaculum sp. AHE15PA]|uniref:PepSY domain-containing protein n=1 Tax=unclassified Tenacibaculum TaxID=2635139 RepID=UPI001C4F4BF6|nr:MULTISPECIES: PepSY domain-containing protein [unclassified Tenacibaculum]QXP74742.1 PepSY domain-containing protein [Tenacibaculum sp. AHE14PA]QXP76253.1 PepSY domain-containing protein [Tenacibaculum sp. AHE15PA]